MIRQLILLTLLFQEISPVGGFVSTAIDDCFKVCCICFMGTGLYGAYRYFKRDKVLEAQITTTTGEIKEQNAKILTESEKIMATLSELKTGFDGLQDGIHDEKKEHYKSVNQLFDRFVSAFGFMAEKLDRIDFNTTPESEKKDRDNNISAIHENLYFQYQWLVLRHKEFANLKKDPFAEDVSANVHNLTKLSQKLSDLFNQEHQKWSRETQKLQANYAALPPVSTANSKMVSKLYLPSKSGLASAISSASSPTVPLPQNNTVKLQTPASQVQNQQSRTGWGATIIGLANWYVETL